MQTVGIIENIKVIYIDKTQTSCSEAIWFLTPLVLLPKVSSVELSIESYNSMAIKWVVDYC